MADLVIDTDEKRKRAFWLSCLPNRIALASVATIACTNKLIHLEACTALYLGAWGISLLYKSVHGLREKRLAERISSNGADEQEVKKIKKILHNIQYGNFGGQVWWKKQRFVHSISLLLYSFGTLLRYENAFVFAIIDVTFAIFSGVFHFVFNDKCTCPFDVQFA